MKRRLLALVLLAPAFGSGCLATQSNVRDLQAELVQMRQASQSQQERLLREIQRQNEMILDSLRLQDVRLRGDVSSQLVRIERQLVQIQELTGQGQQQLAEFRAALQAREDALRRAEAALVTQPAQDADELFATAEGALDRGLTSTARNGFQEFLAEFPDHPRAPAARLNLAAILNDADDKEQALEEYARIV
jgi:TolA-binding protein